MTRYTYESKFKIGDYVKTDGCAELRACITGVLWRNERPSYEIAWISGTANTAWIEEWRLELVDG